MALAQSMGEVACLFACVCNSRLPTCPKFISPVTQGPDPDHRYNLITQASYRIKCCWGQNRDGNARQVTREVLHKALDVRGKGYSILSGCGGGVYGQQTQSSTSSGYCPPAPSGPKADPTPDSACMA